jgi:hypothetical protein
MLCRRKTTSDASQLLQMAQRQQMRGFRELSLRTSCSQRRPIIFVEIHLRRAGGQPAERKRLA